MISRLLSVTIPFILCYHKNFYQRNIPTFAINCIEMYQLNKKNISTNYQYEDYKKTFRNYHLKIKKSFKTG